MKQFVPIALALLLASPALAQQREGPRAATRTAPPSAAPTPAPAPP
ncbi:MAG: hypothetical protein JWN07_177, partial [Hyphomicrobiales bacterium]|nr:hypothetical protein [Hyphomicrobiales bacterium]